MVLSLKRLFLVVVMALALLAGLFGWSSKMMTTPTLQNHHGAIVQTHKLADGGVRTGCPPPPFAC